MKPQVFEFEIQVEAQHIDNRNHVNNLVYLDWCVTAAEQHWERNASEAIKNAYIWYVLKHEINYKAPAFEGDKLLLKTWVENNSGVRSERRYQIWKQDKLLVEAKTLWVLLQANNQRPAAIPEEIRNLFNDE